MNSELRLLVSPSAGVSPLVAGWARQQRTFAEGAVIQAVS
jgi:hypothetical protein